MTQIATDKFSKIREMWFSGNSEDRILAENWLIELVGEKNAKGNLFIMAAFPHTEGDWIDYILDGNNYCRMKFTTYPIAFGKDYRYTVDMSAKYEGKYIVAETNDYSRYQVGMEQPEFDFSCRLCEKLKAMGIQFYNELFYTHKPKTP